MLMLLCPLKVFNQDYVPKVKSESTFTPSNTSLLMRCASAILIPSSKTFYITFNDFKYSVMSSICAATKFYWN